MSDSNSHFTVWGFIKGFGKLIIGLLLIIQGLIGLVVMLLLVGVLVNIAANMAGNNDGVSVAIPDGAALLLNPSGALVEQAAPADAFTVILGEASGAAVQGQVEVHDIVRVLRGATEDDRIKGLVLDLARLQIPASSASKAHYIAEEIAKFKQSGKKVIAIGDDYGQPQYLLAAGADEIYMNDYGSVFLYGYGSYPIYYKSLLERLKVTTHVFRVGTFKSAVEPYIRDDMSPEAKEANLAFLNVLWRDYTAAIEKARGLQSGAIDNYANNFVSLLEAASGDLGKAALDYGLIDGLKSRAEIGELLTEAFGESRDGRSFKNVGYARYLASLNDPVDDNDPNIAVITAAGTIVDGEAPIGAGAGGDTVAGLLRKAREDDKIKAVVLRVDSPGGSAFASDVIRDELIAIKNAGKPLIASMGSMAASGGYWISAPADEIWASPTTITGSIGIFGLTFTWENTAAELGVFTDGVGTTALTPALAAGFGPLPDDYASILQQSTESGYERFLRVVEEGRGLDKDYVDSIGQGRVWIGERAQELRLVDKIGDLDEAIAAAAARANLEQYDVIELIEQLTPFERLLRGFAIRALALMGAESRVMQRGPILGKLMGEAEKQFEFFGELNDPNAAYARCLVCE